MKVKIKLLTPTAKTPTYATDGSGCFDIYSDHLSCDLSDYPYMVKLSTGIAVEVPEGHIMLIFGRSGHGINDNVRLKNCTGIIDSDYRGEITVALCKDASKAALFPIKPGDRIAQGLIVPFPRVEFEQVEELSATIRGTGGLGSTGR